MDIRSVSIIDDQADARSGSIELLEDMGIIPVPLEGPLGDIDNLVEELANSVDGVICDYKLGIRNYASFDGDQIVSRLYQRHIPTVLCTKFDHSASNHLVTTRRHIPSIINPEDLDEEALQDGFRLCIQEHAGNFIASREGHRTLITVEDTDDDGNLFVLVPAWTPHETILIKMTSLPSEVSREIKKGQGFFHTRVNIGCDDVSELYFDADSWEIG